MIGRTGDAAELPLGRRLWPNIAWFAVLTGATAVLGFVLAILIFFVAFLRIKARASWPQGKWTDGSPNLSATCKG